MDNKVYSKIFWVAIIIIAIFIGLTYLQERKEKSIESRNTIIEKMCIERAIEKANQLNLEGIAESGNPYLTKENIPGLREDIKNKQFKECMNIWGN